MNIMTICMREHNDRDRLPATGASGLTAAGHGRTGNTRQVQRPSLPHTCLHADDAQPVRASIAKGE